MRCGWNFFFHNIGKGSFVQIAPETPFCLDINHNIVLTLLFKKMEPRGGSGSDGDTQN